MREMSAIEEHPIAMIHLPGFHSIVTTGRGNCFDITGSEVGGAFGCGAEFVAFNPESSPWSFCDETMCNSYENAAMRMTRKTMLMEAATRIFRIFFEISGEDAKCGRSAVCSAELMVE